MDGATVRPGRDLLVSSSHVGRHSSDVGNELVDGVLEFGTVLVRAILRQLRNDTYQSAMFEPVDREREGEARKENAAHVSLVFGKIAKVNFDAVVSSFERSLSPIILLVEIHARWLPVLVTCRKKARDCISRQT
jgi:hypothetical protein